MRRLILYSLFYLATSITAIAQTNKFDKLADDILLRIGTYQADSITQRFLKKYVPLIATKPAKGTWSAYPPTENPAPEVSTMHSLLFIKHPFIDLPIKEGCLNILTREQNDKVIGWVNYYVSLTFDSRKLAEQSFEKLCELFDPISTSKSRLQKDNKNVAVFRNKQTTVTADSKNFEWEDEVQCVFTQDEILSDKYKIIFGKILDPMFAEHYGIQR